MANVALTLAEVQALPQNVRDTHNSQTIADALNVTRTATRSRMVTLRTVLEGIIFSNSIPILEKLDALVGSNTSAKWFMKAIMTDAGIDVGDPGVRNMLDALVGVGGIVQADINKLKGLGTLPDTVTEFEVRQVCWSNNGTWLA